MEELEAPDIDLPDPEGRPSPDEDEFDANSGEEPSDTEDSQSPESTSETARNESPGALTDRVREERRQAFNPYVITAHRHNYALPVAYSSGINESIYEENGVPLREGLQPVEVKFQISLKTQLNEKDLFLKDDSLSLGITLEAWWQLYSSDLSSPFRETNYSPEIFYMKPLLYGPYGGSTAVVFGLEHESNGQVQGLSRSWNRLYAMLLYERGSFVGTIRPWYRIPESKKKEPTDPAGDDNPDILDFMGHGEVSFAWRDSKYEFEVRGRGNPSTGKGAITLAATYPLFGKFRGFVQYFNGYGDSLIDYNFFQQRIGLGVALTNLY